MFYSPDKARRDADAKRRREAAMTDYKRRNGTGTGQPYDANFTYGGLYTDPAPAQAAGTFSGGGGSSGGAGASGSYESSASSSSSDGGSSGGGE